MLINGLSGTLAVVFHSLEPLPGFVVNGVGLVVEISGGAKSVVVVGAPVDDGGTTIVVFVVCVEVSKMQSIKKLMIA